MTVASPSTESYFQPRLDSEDTDKLETTKIHSPLPVVGKTPRIRQKSLESDLLSPPMVQECHKLRASAGEYVDPTLLAAYEFLCHQARSRCETKEDYLKALAGCRAAKSLFGHHQEYSRALQNISQQLLAELPLVLQLQEVWFREDLLPAIDKLFRALEKHLPADVHATLRANIMRAFEK